MSHVNNGRKNVSPASLFDLSSSPLQASSQAKRRGSEKGRGPASRNVYYYEDHSALSITGSASSSCMLVKVKILNNKYEQGEGISYRNNIMLLTV